MRFLSAAIINAVGLISVLLYFFAIFLAQEAAARGEALTLLLLLLLLPRPCACTGPVAAISPIPRDKPYKTRELGQR